MSALDELLSRWRSNPDADSTIALCSFLGTSSREELIREVAASAETWHVEDSAVMLSVGRMYLDAEMLAEAQAALVAAGKADGRDPKPFRYLGEVLLRRGDAVRAEKVLARSMQLGPSDNEARLWHDRAAVYSALQARVGVEAVATEVRRTMPKQNSIPPPTVQPHSHRFGNEELTRPRAHNPVSADAGDASLPRFESEDPVRVSEVDLIEDSRPIQVAAPVLAARKAASRATTLGMGPPGPSLPTPQPKRAPASVLVSALSGKAAPLPAFNNEVDLEDETRIAHSSRRFEDAITTVTPAPFVAPPAPQPFPAGARAPLPQPPAPPPASFRPAPPPPSPASQAADPWAATQAASPPLPARPVAPSPFRPEPFDEYRAVAPSLSDLPNPEPSLVLQHLSRVGVYEPGGGAPPAWETPSKQKTRGTWTLSAAIVLIAAVGAGSWQYSRKIRTERMQHAVALNTEVKKLLQSGSVSDLKKTDEKLNEAFELDSRSQEAARLWLQNRVLNELLTSDEVHGIDSAVHRGRTVEVPENDLIFGRIASFMAEGDLAGGAGILPRSDKDCARDAYYQLAAGALLERAGDLRAVERYDAARQLDPDFVPAQLLLARLLLLEFGSERAKPVMDALHKLTGDTPITRALNALAWVVDAERPDSLPSEAKLEAGDADKLPAPLRGVPAMVDAVQAMHDGDLAKASRSIDSAVSTAMTPSLATGLGFLAIEAGDEQLGRKAALRALQFAAVYPRARVLAARVALLAGRLEEAQKAIEELDPASADVAVVRGVVAYESLEPGDLDAALKALGEASSRAPYAALVAGPGLLMGRAYPAADKLEAMANPKIPWGEIVAADTALDTGNFALAARILGRRQGDALRAVHYLRLARLNRYQNKPDEAVKAAALARDGSTTASVLIEAIYDLIKKDDGPGARDLLAKHPAVLGPMTAWLSALVDVANKQKAQAAVRVAKLDLPAPEAPLLMRVLVARSLAASGDKRARPYVLALAKQVPKHPDVAEAALALK